MEPPTVHKTYKYKLKPTAEQEQAMAFVVRRCRELYNAGLEERQEAWRKRGVSITLAGQSAQLPDIKDVRPEYRDVHAQVLQDVLTRLDRAFQAFFRRVKAGETPGYPRFQGSNRYNSFTYKQFGNGAMLDNGFLVLSKIGRVAVRWSRPEGPWEGTPKTVTISREADDWYVCISCADVPSQPLAPTGHETGQEIGIDLGLESFATLADGTMIHNPRCYRRAERRLKQPNAGCLAARRAVTAAGKRSNCWRKRIRKYVANVRISSTRPRSTWCATTTRSITKICRSPTW